MRASFVIFFKVSVDLRLQLNLLFCMSHLNIRLTHTLVDHRKMLQTECHSYFVIQKFKLSLRLCKMMYSFIVCCAWWIISDYETNFLWGIFSFQKFRGFAFINKCHWKVCQCFSIEAAYLLINLIGLFKSIHSLGNIYFSEIYQSHDSLNICF